MIICARCGTACLEGERFCRNCGAPLPAAGESAAGNAPGQDPYQQQYSYPAPYGGQTRQGGYEGTYQQSGYEGAYQQGGYDNAWQQNGYGGQYGQGGYSQAVRYGGYAPVMRNTAGIKKRSIPLAIIFSIITFGIYGIYWMIKMNNEVNQLADEPNATSGGLVFLFSVITFGIYELYWLYRMGERCDRIKGTTSSEILYLLLGFFGLSIIVYALIQDTINRTVEMG